MGCHTPHVGDSIASLTESAMASNVVRALVTDRRCATSSPKARQWKIHCPSHRYELRPVDGDERRLACPIPSCSIRATVGVGRGL